jgi:hypothetical protein
VLEHHTFTPRPNLQLDTPTEECIGVGDGLLCGDRHLPTALPFLRLKSGDMTGGGDAKTLRRQILPFRRCTASC